MKRLLFGFCIIALSTATGQELKSYSGPFADGKSPNGTATYKYYEDPETREYVKHGPFTYTLKGQGNYAGYDQTITGSFKNGLKHGVWTYTINMSDYGQGNPYSTGKVTLVANYQDGYAHGNWTQTQAIKKRDRYLAYGQYRWEPFGPLRNMRISMNFDKGHLVGDVDINDEFTQFRAKGSFGNDGLATGTWQVNATAWGKNRELIYKDNYLYEFVARSNSGAVLSGTTKYIDGYNKFIRARQMSESEREEAGLLIERVCGERCAPTNSLLDYMRKQLANEYFLYSWIEGDLTYKEGIQGGCDLQVRQMNYTALVENSAFLMAEEALAKGDLIQALEHFKAIKREYVKPSEWIVLEKKIEDLSPQVTEVIERGIKNYDLFRAYIDSNSDSLAQDFKAVSTSFKLKEVLQYNSYTYKYEAASPQNVTYNSNTVYCTAPWSFNFYGPAEACFNKNPEFFEPHQRLITASYFRFRDELEKQNSANRASIKQVNHDGGRYNITVYREEKLYTAVDSCWTEYNKSKELIATHKAFLALLDKVEEANTLSKKKVLHNKVKLVLADADVANRQQQSAAGYKRDLELLMAFVEKVLVLWGQDTKALEKNLRAIDTPSTIRQLILDV